MRRAKLREVATLKKALSAWRPYIFPGGLPARRHMLPKHFDVHQLAIGTTVELEHTLQPEIALEIAMAHLTEDPRYYAKLERAGL